MCIIVFIEHKISLKSTSILWTQKKKLSIARTIRYEKKGNRINEIWHT